MTSESESPAIETGGRDNSTEGVDLRNNPESAAARDNASSPVARASGSGAPPTPPRPAGAVPGVPDADEAGGTASGDPTAGVQISAADAAEAVPGDEGPEHPGTR